MQVTFQGSGFISRNAAEQSKDRLLSEPLMTENEMMGHLRVCRRHLYTWRMAGLIPYIKIGKAVRFRRRDVEVALEKLSINSSTEKP